MPSFQIACCTEEKWFTHTLTQSSASFRFCCDFNIEQTPSLERVCVTGWSWQWSITRSQQSPKQTSVNTCSSHINHRFLPSPLRFSCLLFWQLWAWGSCHSRWRATESQTLAERRILNYFASSASRCRRRNRCIFWSTEAAASAVGGATRSSQHLLLFLLCVHLSTATLVETLFVYYWCSDCRDYSNGWAGNTR